MEQFEVQLFGATYTIMPQDNRTFLVMEGQQELGTIYPEAGTLGIEWKANDGLEEGFAEQLGELITEHELGKSVL